MSEEIRKRKENKTWIGIIVVVLLFTAALSFITFNLEVELQEGENVLEVSKRIEREEMPDKATITFSIVSLDEDINKALQKNSEINNRIMMYYEEREDLTISTTGYSIQEKEEWNKSSEKYDVLGYEVYNTLSIETKNLDDLGNIINEVIGMEANRVESVAFEISNEKKEELYKEMLEEGVEKAKEEAEMIADMMDKEIKEIANIYKNEAGTYPIYLRSEVLLKENQAIDAEVPIISPEKQTLALDVVVSFELKD